MKIRIAVMVGSNGKVAADIDGNWGRLSDRLVDFANGGPKDPEATARYVVTAEVPIPIFTTLVIAGTVEPGPVDPTETK